jgi:hypothetical protein
LLGSLIRDELPTKPVENHGSNKNLYMKSETIIADRLDLG